MKDPNESKLALTNRWPVTAPKAGRWRRVYLSYVEVRRLARIRIKLT